MPATYVINVQLQLVETQASGVLTEAEIWAHRDKLAVDPEFRPTFRQLWDVTHVTRFDLTAECLRLAATESIFAATARRAILAPNSEGYGLGRMWALQSEYFGRDLVNVFRDRESAMQWLLEGDRAIELPGNTNTPKPG